MSFYILDLFFYKKIIPFSLFHYISELMVVSLIQTYT